MGFPPGISMGEMTACWGECSMQPENCLEKVSKDTRQSILGYFAIYPWINGQVSKELFFALPALILFRFNWTCFLSTN